MDIFSYKAVFFDLDGTMVDSARDLSFAINQMSDELQLKNPDISDVKKWIGNGTRKLVERSLIYSTAQQPSAKELDHAYVVFSDAYRACLGEHGLLYHGVKELLVRLLSHKIKLACITNKPYEFVEYILQQNMISQFFSLVCAGDKVKYKKPHPWPVLHACQVFNLDIKDCVMIGDSRHDVNAAKSAGCDIIAVNYGYNHGQNIADSDADLVIDSFDQLL